MSGPLAEPLASTTASGFEDGFGRRVLAVDREDGTYLERLYLRPEFSAYERALQETVDRLAAVDDERIAAPRGIERDEATGELVVVSPYIHGDRLSDLIELAHAECRDESVVPGIDVAIGVLLELLPALEVLRARTGLPHGAVSASRLILSPAGRLFVVEAGFSAVLQRLNLHRSRLWNEFRIAMPPVAGGGRFDTVADIAQAAVSAVALALGRPLDHRETPDLLPDLMAETIEIAQLRGSVVFAVAWQRFLQRALPLPGRRPYENLDVALRDVRQLASAIGGDMCGASLAMFARQMNAPAGGGDAGVETFAVPLAYPHVEQPHVEQPHIEQPREPFLEEAETVVSLDAAPVIFEDEPPAVVAAQEPEPLRDWEPPQERMEAPEPEPAAAEKHEPRAEPEAIVVEVPTAVAVAAEPEPAPVAEPQLAPEPAAEWPLPAVAAAEPEPVSIVAPAPEPEPVPETAEMPEPEPAKQPARRRRGRGGRHDGDTLRSTVLPPPPPEPPSFRAPAPSVMEPEPWPSTAAPAPSYAAVPIFEPPPAPIPQPVFPAPQMAPRQPLWEPPRPAVPVPVAAPPVTPIAVAAPQPIPVAPIAVVAPSAPLRIKTEAPAGFVGRTARHEPPMFAPSQRAEPRGGMLPAGRGLPWKAAAAAAVLLGGIFAAGQVYVPDRETLKAEISEPQPAKTVAAPAAVKTGTLIVQSQPAGARVLLDGGAVGETPLRIVDVAPGRHVVTLVTSSATVKRTVRVDADRTVTVDVPVFSGWVAIFAPVVLEVSEDGRSLGTTEQDRILLPPGRHRLTLTNRALGYSTTAAVDVEAGEVASLNIQPRGSVNLNAQPWAEVWIDGQKAGETPIANLELPLGTREIIFRHPQFGERRVTTTIRAGVAAAVSIDFTK